MIIDVHARRPAPGPPRARAPGPAARCSDQRSPTSTAQIARDGRGRGGRCGCCRPGSGCSGTGCRPIRRLAGRRLVNAGLAGGSGPAGRFGRWRTCRCRTRPPRPPSCATRSARSGWWARRSAPQSTAPRSWTTPVTRAVLGCGRGGCRCFVLVHPDRALPEPARAAAPPGEHGRQRGRDHGRRRVAGLRRRAGAAPRTAGCCLVHGGGYPALAGRPPGPRPRRRPRPAAAAAEPLPAPAVLRHSGPLAGGTALPARLRRRRARAAGLRITRSPWATRTPMGTLPHAPASPTPSSRWCPAATSSACSRRWSSAS